MIRASGGQLITRVKAEIAAGKLIADLVDHSDRGLMEPLEDSFTDYAPPNAGDYLPASQFSTRFWPRITPVWCIAYNSELTKTPPKGWMDLTNAGTYAPGIIGPGHRPVWRNHLDPGHVRAPDLWRGLLGQAGRNQTHAVSLQRADHRRGDPRRGLHRPDHPQRHLSQAEGWRAR